LNAAASLVRFSELSPSDVEPEFTSAAGGAAGATAAAAEAAAAAAAVVAPAAAAPKGGLGQGAHGVEGSEGISVTEEWRPGCMKSSCGERE